jgi:hypothetical protein
MTKTIDDVADLSGHPVRLNNLDVIEMQRIDELAVTVAQQHGLLWGSDFGWDTGD